MFAPERKVGVRLFCAALPNGFMYVSCTDWMDYESYVCKQMSLYGIVLDGRHVVFSKVGTSRGNGILCAYILI